MLSEQDVKVLNEVAEMLNISISVIEHYPTDLQRLLINTYLTSKTYKSAIERLQTVIDLSLPKEPKKVKAPHKTLTKPKGYLLTRQTIIDNAKIIKNANK